MSRLSRVVAPCLLAGCALLAPAAASAAPTLQEFSAGLRAGAAPGALAAGPDGNVWFTEGAQPAALGRIAPDGTIRELPIGGPSGAAPAGVAAGPDGNVWFTVPGGPALGRMTPAGQVARFAAGLSDKGRPTDLAPGPDRAVWFTTLEDGRVGRIAASGSIVEGPAAGKDASPQGIVTGPDGGVWWSQQTSAGSVVRADPVTGAVRSFALPTAGRPTDLAAGPDGAVWFTASAASDGDAGGKQGESGESRTLVARSDSGRHGIVGRIAPDGRTVEHGLPAGLVPGEPAAGPDGALWFTLAGRAALGRLDVAGAVSTVALPAGGAAVDVTAGPAGTLWYTAANPDRIGRLSFPAGGGGTPITPLGPAAPGPALAGAPAGVGVVADAVPDLGQSVVAAAAEGTVKVRPPGARHFIALGAAADAVPVGSLLDTRRGTVALRTAVDERGTTQDGAFRGAIFRVRQTPTGKGMTELVLAGGSFAACRTQATASRASAAIAARRRPVRSLWGSDAGGRFRTRGRDSVATVRGTRWRTTDRCDGTLTHVSVGAVAVREKSTGRTVVVRAGRSHLAPHAG